MKKSQKGFAVFEALLILVAIGLVVFTGWYVVHATNKSSEKSTDSTTGTVTTPIDSTAKPDTDSNTVKGYNIAVEAPSGWTTKKDIYSLEVTDGAGALTLTAGGGGKGCESECTQVTHNYTYQSQDFQESKVTGYPNNQLYWDVIQFKDLTKLEEWSKDTRHTSVTSVSYPQEKRDYYLQIFTGLWLNSVATPVY